MKKLTRENYKELIDVWVNNKNRDINYIFHNSYVSQNDLILYAFEKDIVVTFEIYSEPNIMKMSFKRKLD